MITDKVFKLDLYAELQNSFYEEEFLFPGFGLLNGSISHSIHLWWRIHALPE